MLIMQPYTEQKHILLQSFKQEINLEKNSPENRPYSFIKPSILHYRIAFLAIGVVYFVLAFILMSKSLSWTCALLFDNCAAIKTLLLLFCGSVSAVSIYYSISISTEKEVVKFVIRNSKRKLRRMMRRKFSFFNPSHTVAPQPSSDQTDILDLHLSKILDKMDGLQIECLHLVNRIYKSESLESYQKEELLNQAVIELRFKLEKIIDAFAEELLNV